MSKNINAFSSMKKKVEFVSETLKQRKRWNECDHHPHVKVDFISPKGSQISKEIQPSLLTCMHEDKWLHHDVFLKMSSSQVHCSNYKLSSHQTPFILCLLICFPWSWKAQDHASRGRTEVSTNLDSQSSQTLSHQQSSIHQLI